MDRSIPVWVAAALALVVLMALPLGWIGWVSVSSESGPTLAHYATVFQDPQLQKALWNTVVMAFWVGLASVALGAPMAWLTARTDLPGQTLIRGLIMASFVTPPFLGAFAWVMLAGPNAGLLNKLYRNLSGADDALVNIFTIPGLFFLVAMYTLPYGYIMIANTQVRTEEHTSELQSRPQLVRRLLPATVSATPTTVPCSRPVTS